MEKRLNYMRLLQEQFKRKEISYYKYKKELNWIKKNIKKS